MIIETPSRGLLEAHIIYKDHKVRVLGRELTIDFILLNFSGFNIILDMDWLESYHAVIDCYDKTLTLSPSHKGTSLEKY